MASAAGTRKPRTKSSKSSQKQGGAPAEVGIGRRRETDSMGEMFVPADALFGATTQRVADFTATGTAGNVLTIQGSSATSPCTLVHTGAGNISIDYVTITGVRAYQL